MSHTCVEHSFVRSKPAASQESSEMFDGFPGDPACTVSTPDSLTDGSITTYSSTYDRPSPTAQTLGLHLNQQILQSIETSSPVQSTLSSSQTSPCLLHKAPNISSRRGLDISLPRFDEISTSISAPMNEMTENACSSPDRSRLSKLVRAVSNQQLVRSNSCGPLTPPQEIELLSWITELPTHPSQASSEDRTQDSTHPGQEIAQPSVHHFFAPPNANSIPQARDISSLDFAAAPWMLRALRVASEALEIHVPTASAKIISQVLPPNTSDQRQIKTYEVVCDHLQRILPEPQYVNITHALTVSPGQVVEDFPKSPPATPNLRGGDSYFGDQTVFTHAAQVPIHHEVKTPNANSTTSPPQRHIMIAEANLVILERYIPPTTREETTDFFEANSCRSYLADRLPELAVDVGSLMLIYPTKTGGQTFARQYVGPILDPILREMIILKGLNTNAAEVLGSFKGLASLLEFDEMKSTIQDLCASMNARQATKKSRTEFCLDHSECTQVVLDRKTWLTWFVEQEQQRMKQDLVEYHRDGGRLPESEGRNTELTVGMLTREVIEGLRKSTTVSGGTGIEVGVFVIRRHRRPATL